MAINTGIDVKRLKNVVEECCKTPGECGSCQGKECLIGYAKMVLKFADAKNINYIPQGDKLLPVQDFKTYDQQALIKALAETCVQCKNCQDSHEDHCIVNLTRMAMENALLGENLKYQGSTTSYLIQVSRINESIGKSLMSAFQELKKY